MTFPSSASASTSRPTAVYLPRLAVYTGLFQLVDEIGGTNGACGALQSAYESAHMAYSHAHGESTPRILYVLYQYDQQSSSLSLSLEEVTSTYKEIV